MQAPETTAADFTSKLSPWLAKAESPWATVSSGEKEAALAQVESAVRSCQRCGDLAAARTNTVFADGSARARLVFIGEAPGYNEDRRGLPFVGEAGQLLDKMLHAAGMSRQDVYICNVLKCRPPENRKPLPQEVILCRPYLTMQLRIIRPQLICCLGATAAHALLDVQDSMGRLRGRTFSYEGIPLIATWHPAYLLRTPERKRDAWEDMQRIVAMLGGKGSLHS